MSNDDLVALLNRHVTALMEHFDAVQIVASKRCEHAGTTRFESGRGSWFERYGLMHAWSVRADEGTRLEAQAEREADD